MNRNILVTIIVVLLIAGAGGYYLTTRQSAEPAQIAQDNVQPSVQASAASEKTSLKNFMAMGGTKECQFSDPETGNSGTAYIDSGKMKGDFSSEVNGKKTETHMINNGKDIYIWTDGQQMGFKTSLEAIEAMSGQTGTIESVNVNKEVDYKCSDWTADPLKFAIPAEIKFSSMDDMMKSMQKMMPSGSPSGSAPEENPDACKTCESLEGQAKIQCKTALKCN